LRGRLPRTVVSGFPLLWLKVGMSFLSTSPLPSSNRTCRFTASGSRRLFFGLLHESSSLDMLGKTGEAVTLMQGLVGVGWSEQGLASSMLVP